MKRLRFWLAWLLGCCAVSGFAQAGYLHVELQAGYELFPEMSAKSGYDINIGGRYAFNDRYFVAGTLHGGINNGTYEGVYAGEPTRLDHTLRSYMVGVGPGVYLYNGGDGWIYADVLAGYGFGEELKSSAESRSKSLAGLAAALRLGVEKQLAGHIVGLSVGGYLVGGRIRPAINLKWGLFLNL